MSHVTLVVGSFSGALQVESARDVHVRVEREVILTRELDGTWGIVVNRPDAGDEAVTGITATDPQVGRFLDLFAAMLADPDAYAGQDPIIGPSSSDATAPTAAEREAASADAFTALEFAHRYGDTHPDAVAEVQRRVGERD